ncbi:hypothetical protein Fmac_019587 [Flemingia macrophylla]|uniref:HMA domain-containing protein n=1 Tax=Flemingia macrophylla TaxID=520843 RepID=A0ABD1M876_9FABA
MEEIKCKPELNWEASEDDRMNWCECVSRFPNHDLGFGWSTEGGELVTGRDIGRTLSDNTKLHDEKNIKQAKKGECANKGKRKEETTSPTTSTATSTTVVFKVDMHCDGCASKIVKCIRGFQGVETWKTEIDTGKLTVTGKVDPTKLSDKTKKNVELVSPHSNKDKENKDKKPKDKQGQTQEKTVVLKVPSYCRCQGCFHRLHKEVLKVKGVCDVALESHDEWWMVTAKCTMDVNVVAGTLSKKLKRVVEVVPTKKEKEKEKKEKEKENEGEEEGDKGGNSAGAKKKKKGGDGEVKGNGSAKGKTELEEGMMYCGVPTRDYANGGYGDSNYMGHYNHVAQMFSEENPYACRIM